MSEFREAVQDGQSRRCRVGVNCFLLAENSGGLRQYFCRLFRELLVDEGLRFTFFCAERNVSLLREIGDLLENGEVVVLQEQLDVADYWERLDLFFCPFGPLFPRPVPIPSVIMLADIQEKYYPEFFSVDQLWERAFHFDHSLLEADRVITISDHSRMTFVEKHGIPESKVAVAYLAPSEIFVPETAVVTPVPNLPRRFVFFPATRWKHKNHELLFMALRALRIDHGVDVPCVLTGYDMADESDGQDLLARLGIENLVHPLGFVSEPQLATIYAKATMLVFPSLFEGFGMPVVEAMACGCPVVSSNVTSLPEVAGDAALFFDPTSPEDCARQIVRFWNDEGLREAYRAKGLVRARSFSFAETARVHREVFSELISNPPVRESWRTRVLRERMRDLRILTRRPAAIPSILRHAITRKIRRLLGLDGLSGGCRERGRGA